MTVTEFIDGIKLVIKKLNFPVENKNIIVNANTKSYKCYGSKGNLIEHSPPSETFEWVFGNIEICTTKYDEWVFIVGSSREVLAISNTGVEDFIKLLMKKKKAIKELIQ